VKINTAKPTLIKLLRKTHRKRDIGTFDFSKSVMKNIYVGATLTQSAETMFSQIIAP